MCVLDLVITSCFTLFSIAWPSWQYIDLGLTVHAPPAHKVHGAIGPRYPVTPHSRRSRVQVLPNMTTVDFSCYFRTFVTKPLAVTNDMVKESQVRRIQWTSIKTNPSKLVTPFFLSADQQNQIYFNFNTQTKTTKSLETLSSTFLNRFQNVILK